MSNVLLEISMDWVGGKLLEISIDWVGSGFISLFLDFSIFLSPWNCGSEDDQ